MNELPNRQRRAGPAIRSTEKLLALLFLKQVKDVGAYLRGIGVPTLIPVPVNFPADAGKASAVHGTPLANLGMGFGETPIRTKVSGSRHRPGRQL